ncbi:MAG: hypothetical protein JKY50_04920 [Oleispira sp.]|nr:hypothetical protein [Oleispira sp.]
MRAGQLKDAATLKGSNGIQLGALRLVGLEDKDQSISFGEGLKSSAKITIRSRWNQEIVPGNFWSLGSRLFLIDGVSDPAGAKRDLVSSVTELIGAPALIVDTDAIVKCALTKYRSKPEGGHDYLSASSETERRQAEFANVQYRPEIGHEFNLASALYRIIEHDESESDSVVSRCWVEFLNYV